MSVGRTAGATDTGRRRRRNEDAYVVQPPLFAVADGVGGAQAGEVASRLAAAALEDDPGGGGGEARVAALIQEANRRVHEAATADSSRSGMGTTMTVALVEGDTVAIGHVGDSRAYRSRGGELEQLTDDHSLVAELVRSGSLSPEEARVHPQRNVVTRALGSDPDVDVDTFTVAANPGDVFLLCSDGLSTMVEDDEIQATLDRHRSDLDAAVRELIRQALRAGGEDNITVVCFEIAEAGAGELTEELERTREQALPQAEEQDADTLDELDGVASVQAEAAPVPGPGDTMVVSAAELEAARQEQESPRKRRRRERDERRGILAPALLILLIALIVVLAVWGLTR